MRKLDELARKLAGGQIDRRQFMAGALAAGASFTAASMLAGKAAQAAEPKKGGTLRQAVTGGGTGDVLDPAQTLGCDL